MNRAFYRKKPVVIEAIQFTGTNQDECIGFCYLPNVTVQSPRARAEAGALYIKTLEGEMRADPGDYIIRGVGGEVYPCKPAIFAATYEKTT